MPHRLIYNDALFIWSTRFIKAFALNFVLKLTLSILVLFSIAACSPKFNWRDAQDGVSPYKVLMPGKPSVLSREIQIGQQNVTMHMTATEIDGVKFAVGAAKMSDATVAQTSVGIIKNTLLQNIGGQLTEEKATVVSENGKLTYNNAFAARSTAATPATSTAPIRMLGRLIARDDWVFQVLVVGPEKAIDSDAAETFLGSFKAQ